MPKYIRVFVFVFDSIRVFKDPLPRHLKPLKPSNTRIFEGNFSMNCLL